jgi:hypothetical protein
MPPKSENPDLASDSWVPLFTSVGLTHPQAIEAVKNPKGAAVLKTLIEDYRLADVQLTQKQAILVAAFAVQAAKSETLVEGKRDLIVREVLEERLLSVDQVSGMFSSLGGQ